MVAPEPAPKISTGQAPSRPPAAAVVLVLPGALDPADVPGLAERLIELLEGRPGRLVACDVASIDAPDIGTIDALARLALALHRAGCRLRLERASVDLKRLVTLTGLRAVLPCSASSVVEVGRQSEEREEPGGVEEERDPGDHAI